MGVWGGTGEDRMEDQRRSSFMYVGRDRDGGEVLETTCNNRFTIKFY